MSKIISHNFTGKSLVVVYNDNGVQQRIVESSHANWESIMAEYRAGNMDGIIPLLDVTNCITAKSNGKFTFKDGVFSYKGKPTSGYLFEKALFFLKQFPKQYDRLMRFADNLYANPSERAHNELYRFLEKGHMPITDDGCFLGYKAVQRDYFSVTGGTAKPVKGEVNSEGKIFNGVGEIVEIARKDCDDNSARDCSYGIHVGSHNYASTFHTGGHLMIVKVNPKDVVSVPESDANKLRCCKYEVIAEYGKKLDEKRDVNFDKAAQVRYHTRRGADGKFVSAKAPHRNALGQFVTAAVKR